MSAKFKVYIAFALYITLGWLIFSTFIEPKEKIDPELRHFYDEFNKLVKDNCNKRGIISNPSRIKIEFIDYINERKDSNVVIGQCQLGLFKYRVIIHRKWYASSTLLERYNLLYHELSHCILKLQHIDDYNNFMYPEMVILPYDKLKQQVVNEIKAICQ